MKLTTFLPAALALVLTAAAPAEPLKVGCADRLGHTLLEVAQQKGWFKDAGVDVELVWSDGAAALDAFAAGKLDGVCCVANDALVRGAGGAKSKLIAILGHSVGQDVIVGAPGVSAIGDLQGRKVGVEVTLAGHLLLLHALKTNGMKQSDILLVNTPAAEAAATLAAGKVGAVGAWSPGAGQVLKAVAESKPIFTSADARGLIYDVLAVTPGSLAKRKSDWSKVVGVYYRSAAYVLDPQTREDAARIMAAKAGAEVAAYTEALAGCQFLTLAEAKKNFRKRTGESLYGALTTGNKLNLESRIYSTPQKPDTYLAPSLVEALK